MASQVRVHPPSPAPCLTYGRRGSRPVSRRIRRAQPMLSPVQMLLARSQRRLQTPLLDQRPEWRDQKREGCQEPLAATGCFSSGNPFKIPIRLLPNKCVEGISRAMLIYVKGMSRRLGIGADSIDIVASIRVMVTPPPAIAVILSD